MLRFSGTDILVVIEHGPFVCQQIFCEIVMVPLNIFIH